jgi:hypothetical protein
LRHNALCANSRARFGASCPPASSPASYAAQRSLIRATGNRAVRIGTPSRPHSLNEAGEMTLRHNGNPGRCTGRGRYSGTFTWKYLPL